MNFGESLAYWYFRLNGFIPLTNFVLHRPDTPRRYNTGTLERQVPLIVEVHLEHAAIVLRCARGNRLDSAEGGDEALVVLVLRIRL